MRRLSPIITKTLLIFVIFIFYALSKSSLWILSSGIEAAALRREMQDHLENRPLGINVNVPTYSQAARFKFQLEIDLGSIEVYIKLSKQSQFLYRVAFVATYFCFAKSGEWGLDIGKLRKKHRPAKVVMLCSDREFDNFVCERAIDRVVSKVALTYLELV